MAEEKHLSLKMAQVKPMGNMGSIKMPDRSARSNMSLSKTPDTHSNAKDA